MGIEVIASDSEVFGEERDIELCSQMMTESFDMATALYMMRVSANLLQVVVTEEEAVVFQHILHDMDLVMHMVHQAVTRTPVKAICLVEDSLEMPEEE